MPLVTVTGRFELPDNTPAPVGTMTWWLTPSDVPDTVEPVTVLAGPVAAPIDGTGAFTVALRATDDPALTEHVSGALVYRVRRTGTLGYGEWNVTVPAPGPWDWTELSPAPNGHGVVTPIPGPVGPPGPPGEGFAHVFDLRTFGDIDTSGGTDTTEPINAALAAIAAAGGGELYWPTGTIRVDGPIILPNNAAAIPAQNPMRWRGAGAYFSGRQQAAPVGGTILDLRYVGPAAKIQTFGLGLFAATGITFTDKGTSSNPFLLSTNTTLLIEGCSFSGNPTKATAACDQDCIVLGGTTTTIGNTATSPFQGYGTVISRCYFDRIRRGVYGRAYCNGVVVRDCTWWATCGGGATAAAIELDGYSTSETNTGAYVTGNLIEAVGYTQAVKCQRTVNSYFANNFYDPGAITSWYLFGDDAKFNTIVDVYRDDSKALLIQSSASAIGNTIITSHQSQFSIAAQPWRFTNPTPTEFTGAAVLAKAAARGFLWQPDGDPAETSVAFEARRSAAAATNPGTNVFQVLQNGTLNVGGSVAGAVNFADAAGTVQTRFTGTARTWQAVGAGGGMIIDSGSGGSNIDYKGFRHRFWNHAGVRFIALASAVPTDASIANGELVMWFDPAVGACKLMLRGKNTTGTVVNAAIVLT